MGSGLFQFDVTGTKELAKNLAQFGGPRMLGKIIGNSLRAGAQLPLERARVNARALGLGFRGFVPRRHEGESHGQRRRYGRIPPSLKANRAYIPRGQRDTYRLNVVARTQRRRGVFRNKAPHAVFWEYGFRHLGSGKKFPPVPFIGPALDATAPQVVQVIATRMTGLIDGLRFPTTGRGP